MSSNRVRAELRALSREQLEARRQAILDDIAAREIETLEKRKPYDTAGQSDISAQIGRQFRRYRSRQSVELNNISNALIYVRDFEKATNRAASTGQTPQEAYSEARQLKSTSLARERSTEVRQRGVVVGGSEGKITNEEFNQMNVQARAAAYYQMQKYERAPSSPISSSNGIQKIDLRDDINAQNYISTRNAQAGFIRKEPFIRSAKTEDTRFSASPFLSTQIENLAGIRPGLVNDTSIFQPSSSNGKYGTLTTTKIYTTPPGVQSQLLLMSQPITYNPRQVDLITPVSFSTTKSLENISQKGERQPKLLAGNVPGVGLVDFSIAGIDTNFAFKTQRPREKVVGALKNYGITQEKKNNSFVAGGAFIGASITEMAGSHPFGKIIVPAAIAYTGGSLLSTAGGSGVSWGAKFFSQKAVTAANVGGGIFAGGAGIYQINKINRLPTLQERSEARGRFELDIVVPVVAGGFGYRRGTLQLKNQLQKEVLNSAWQVVEPGQIVSNERGAGVVHKVVKGGFSFNRREYIISTEGLGGETFATTTGEQGLMVQSGVKNRFSDLFPKVNKITFGGGQGSYVVKSSAGEVVGAGRYVSEFAGGKVGGLGEMGLRTATIFSGSPQGSSVTKVSELVRIVPKIKIGGSLVGSQRQVVGVGAVEGLLYSRTGSITSTPGATIISQYPNQVLVTPVLKLSSYWQRRKTPFSQSKQKILQASTHSEYNFLEGGSKVEHYQMYRTDDTFGILEPYPLSPVGKLYSSPKVKIVFLPSQKVRTPHKNLLSQDFQKNNLLLEQKSSVSQVLEQPKVSFTHSTVETVGISQHASKSFQTTKHSFLKGGSLGVLGVGLSQGSSQNQFSASKISSVQSLGQSSNSLLFSRLSSSSKLSQNLRVGTAQNIGLISAQKQTPALKLTTIGFIGFSPSPPSFVPPSTPLLGVPLFWGDAPKLQSRAGGWYGGRRGFAYVPDLHSIVLGIRGRAGTPRGGFTGFEARPLSGLWGKVGKYKRKRPKGRKSGKKRRR